MSQNIRKPDVYEQLGHEALAARRKGVTPQTAQTARDVLRGALASPAPYVAVSEETPWAQVADYAISSSGKIAVLGIEPDGRKEIIEWTVIGRRWTRRAVYSAEPGARIDHLCYPEGDEDVAFTVTRESALYSHVFWGKMSIFDIPVRSLRLDSVHYFWGKVDDQRRHLVAILTDGNFQRAFHFIEGESTDFERRRNCEIAVGTNIKFLGVFGGKIALRIVNNKKEAVWLIGKPGEEAQKSDWYDQILPEFAMERDGELSFVGWMQDGNHSRAIQKGPQFIRALGEVSRPGLIHRLPSGRILIEERQEGEYLDQGDTRAIGDLRLRNTIDGGEINLGGVREIIGIVEVPHGLVVHTLARDDKHDLVFVKERGSNPGQFSFFTSAKTGERISHLRCWNNHLVFQVGDQLRVIDARDDNWAYDPAADEEYLLYTDFDHLAPTEEGILGWDFVNGHIRIFRYPL